MKIKKVTQNEFETLMELMNVSFQMKDDDQFEHILPKFYYKENEEMIHYGVYEENRLVASIGLYPMTLKSKYGTLNVACVGAVSTHPDFRLKGYFKMLMKKILQVAKKEKYDLLFLGGNRYRYGHYGFENAGRKLVVCLSARTKKELRPCPYQVERLNENDHLAILECLKMYNRQPQHVLRNQENFYKHVISWNCVPYIVKVNEKIVGYFSLKDNHHVYEMLYKKKYKDCVLDACLLDKKEIYIQTSMKEYNEDLLHKIDWFRVEHNEMYKVLNWEKVAKYLNFKKGYETIFESFNNKEKIRKGLGNDAFESQFGDESIFIFPCDQG